MTTITESKLSLKFVLMFIPVAFVTYLFHEFGHWIVGEVLGNNMAYSLINVWPQSGHYNTASHELFVSSGGPAFTILLSLLFLLIIEKYITIYAYPVVFFNCFVDFSPWYLVDLRNRMKREFQQFSDLGHTPSQ